MLLEMHELEMQVGIAIQEENVIYSEFDSLVNRVANTLSERNRVANYTLTKLAEEPANRLIYDSLRLKYADSMLLAQQMVYLAMRRADYETAGKIRTRNSGVIRYHRCVRPTLLVPSLFPSEKVPSSKPSSHYLLKYKYGF